MTQTSPDPGPDRARDRSRRGMLEPSVGLLTVRGIPIGIHWSWLIFFALASWTLARTVFPDVYPGLDGNTYVAMAVVSALMLFVSILLHELGHAFRARKENMQIAGITLWLFGGVARFEGMFPSAGAEFRIAVAGPLVSVGLVVVFAALTVFGNAADLPLGMVGVVDYLARINLAVVIFNLVPALPLDGGRILRAWLWSRQNNFTRATVAAARFGKGFGYLLVSLGVLQFLLSSTTGGIWFVVMGWFLLQAAQAEQNYALVRRAFQDVSVSSIMTRDPVVVSPDLSVDSFLALVQAHGHSTYPVVEGGELRGIVSLRMVTEVAAPERSVKRIGDLMAEPVVLDPEAQVVEVIDLLRAPPERAVVVSGGQVVGIVSLADVVRALQMRQGSGRPPGDANGSGGNPSSRRTRTAVIVALAALLPLAAVWYKPPVVIITPAPAFDVTEDFDISGVEVSELSGQYLLVAVFIRQPNTIQAALSYLNPDVDLIPQSALVPAGLSQEEYLDAQKTVFEESQQAAAAAAARAVGLEVVLDGRGAEVLDVVEDAPADGTLQVGDVVIEMDGEPVHLVSDLVDRTTVRPAGTTFDVTVERGSGTRELTVTSARLEGLTSTNTGIGILATTRDLDVQLPFEIEFRDRNIGGPSAGLIYALAIADLLDSEDIARDRSIAASGTVRLSGQVGPVGSLREKLQAAREAQADVFLVPESELDEVQGVGGNDRDPDTAGVEDLEEALAFLNGRG